MAEYNSGYTASQITAMQQDAMRRVNEMQRISREKLKGTNYTPNNKPHSNNYNNTTIPTKNQNNQDKKIEEDNNLEKCNAEVVPNGFGGLLQQLNLDQEKITIIILLFILINEKADMKLILALVYILL